MPKKTVAIDYQSCSPERCAGGICQAALLCKKKVLTQEAPYELPDTKAAMCLSCAVCVPACPTGAVFVI